MNSFIGLLQRKVWMVPLIAVVLLVIGLVLGLVIGWMTVDFKPSTNDVVAAADAYATNADPAVAKQLVRGLSNDELTTTINNLIAARVASNKPLEADRLRMLAQVLGVKVTGAPGTTPAPVGTLAPGATPGAAPTPSPASTGINPMLAIAGIVLVILLAAIAAVVFFLRILPGMRQASAAERSAPTAEKPASGTAPATPKVSGVAPAPTTTPGGLGRFVPTYLMGNDNYDTSYSLETGKGEFLGECGMGISETIGEGKPDKVTAFDLWLFDKADVRTVTQIVMSDFAFKDQTLRTKLATKGEAVLAEKGKTLHLETQSLQIDAHVVDLIYATNPSFPPNSHFQKLVVEIVPTLREVAR